MPNRPLADALTDGERSGSPGALSSLLSALSPARWLRRSASAPDAISADRRMLEGVLDLVTDAVLVLDADGRIRTANDATKSVLGRDPDALTGYDLAEAILASRDRAAYSARLNQYAQAGRGPLPSGEAMTALRADGTEIAVHVSVRPISESPLLFGVTVRDVSAARDLEEAFESTDARRRTLRTIVDSVPLPVVAVTREGDIVLRNQAATHGLKDEPSQQWWQSARDVMQTGEAVYEFEEATASGVQLTTRVPVRDRAGNVAGLVVVARDVTEQKAAEAQLLANMQSAEEAARANREFLATTSHEVRTLMSGVTGMTMLLQNTDLDDEQSEYVDTIHTSSSALLTVINDVLDFSKIESGMLDLEDEPLSVFEVANESLRMVAQQAAGKGLELGMDVSERVPSMVRGDAGRIRQVLVNLLSNAVKFTPEGSVHVAADLTVASGTSALLFSVTDTGIGIAPDRLEAVFEEFAQADSSTSRTHGGTGLGLAICRRLVEMMGGELSAESVQGGGSVFRFTVALEDASSDEAAAPAGHAWIAQPAATRALPAVERESPPEPTPAKDISPEKEADPSRGNVIPMDNIVPMAKILLAEDNPVNQKVTVVTLRRLGYRADVVSNGAEAVEAVRTSAYDVVLMDIMMPVMTGLEATRAICSDAGPHPRPAIVALTANAMKGDRQDCLDAGCDDYLSKPVAPEDLAATIERAVRARTAVAA